MASTPLPGGPRHVGRVIDPSVREDGEPEPALELESGPADLSPTVEDVPSPSENSLQVRGVKFRERLLDRVAQAQRAPENPEEAYADLDQIGQSQDRHSVSGPPPEPEARAPSAPLTFDRRARLSPNQVALFTTLLGTATVASLIALAMNVEVSPRGIAPAPPAASSAPPAPSAAAPAPRPERPKRVREKLPGPWRIEESRTDPRMRVVEGEVKTDAFLNALEKAGIEKTERYRILTSMKGVRDFDRCKKTDRFRVLLEKGSPRVKAFEYIVGPGEVYQSREGSDGLLKGSQLDLKLAHNQVTGSLLYDGESFDRSAEQSGFDTGLRKVVAKALDGHLDMNEIERGDRLRAVAQEQTVLGEFGSYTGIEALELRPSDEKRSPIRIYYFDRAGERGYYDGDGRAPYDGGWRKPVKDAPMTSPFNMKRMHPVLKRVMPHTGVDYGAPTGTPVGASSFGTVSFMGYAGPSGNLVKVEHTGGVETGYAHLSRFAEGLKVGDRVRRLQVIGYVGSTGRSTGPHLHFTATKNGQFFDPITLKLDAMRVVSKEGRETFAQLKAKYDALLDSVPLPDPLPKPVPELEPAASAPASPASEPLAPGEMDAMGEEEPDTAPALGTASLVAPRAPSAPAAGPASGKSMVHLTDKELLELSGAANDGEVDE